MLAASQYFEELKQWEQNSSAVLHNFMAATGQSIGNVSILPTTVTLSRDRDGEIGAYQHQLWTEPPTTVSTGESGCLPGGRTQPDLVLGQPLDQRCL